MHAFVFETISRLISKGIVRSHSMQERGATVRSPVGIVSNCGVCGGLVYNAQRFMHMNDAYFTTSAIWFPYEMKKLIESYMNYSILIEIIHIILHWIWMSWIGYSSIDLFRVGATPFPLPV